MGAVRHGVPEGVEHVRGVRAGLCVVRRGRPDAVRRGGPRGDHNRRRRGRAGRRAAGHVRPREPDGRRPPAAHVLQRRVLHRPRVLDGQHHVLRRRQYGQRARRRRRRGDVHVHVRGVGVPAVLEDHVRAKVLRQGFHARVPEEHGAGMQEVGVRGQRERGDTPESRQRHATGT